ncbi:hypothetical protein E4634_20810 [Mangrovimicrobium sediminis]|uniref:Uncharacterized protein n=1 Tax=Mangrovimicrobium sediminis TaxID=2562682 RepID=A0A4Z0LUE8_9GAMM|nr:hypothetical protein [Haliea sp. SAOS-164]TGD70748.1 hypothetical protein E4634_20810 [Haliea sp. SAOS-164]
MEIPNELHHENLAFSGGDRKAGTKRLEDLINSSLENDGSLQQYQASLYRAIECLEGAGYDIGRWDYDSEMEYWGGQSYMYSEPITDQLRENVDKELHLVSEYPLGIKLFWGNDEPEITRNT